MAQVYQPQAAGDFRHGLFDCCGNCGDCLFAYCLGPCYAYVAAQAAGEDTCTSIMQCFCYPMCLCCLRSNVRAKRGIDGGCLGDFMVTWCCPCCAVIQIKREFTD